VDTHVFRVSNRLGLANAANVEKTEEQLKAAIPKKDWVAAHHWLIFHGRRVCHSQRPACGSCTLNAMCKAFDAAKSFLLYECSKYGSDPLSLMAEYTLACERDYSSSQLYDALVTLSFSDVEHFYNHHIKASTTQFVISRESTLNVHELTSRGRVVHLTYDELYGY
jgi:adenine-specific DNA glycosylase